MSTAFAIDLFIFIVLCRVNIKLKNQFLMLFVQRLQISAFAAPDTIAILGAAEKVAVFIRDPLGPHEHRDKTGGKSDRFTSIRKIHNIRYYFFISHLPNKSSFRYPRLCLKTRGGSGGAGD